MRGALSGPEICNEDNSLNHLYFNTKKGYYWSDKHQNMLVQGVLAHGLDISTIHDITFHTHKS